MLHPTTQKASPLQFSRDVFLHEVAIVTLELLDVRRIRALGVEVKLVELPDPLEHLQILVVAEEHVVLARVPRVERMEPASVNLII